MDRTVIVQLKPTPEQATILQRTLAEHTACFNAVAKIGFETGEGNGVELHKQTYYDLRRRYPDLPAQLVIAARVKATEAVVSALTWAKKHEASYHKRVVKWQKHGKDILPFKPVKAPQAHSCPIRYDARSYWVNWNHMTASLATIGGRLEIAMSASRQAQQYIGHRVCSADLCYRQGHFWLHVVVSIPVPVVEPDPTVIGVDLGETRPAVTSSLHFLGQRRWKAQERRIFRLRRKLQSKGTKSAKRHLRKLSGKLFRQRRDHDHVLSKRLVQHTPAGGTIVLENLREIRSRGERRGKAARRRFHTWSFAQLAGFIAYKAEQRGIAVFRIDPRTTSQRCSRCGHVARNNRRSQSLFLCRKCSYCLNADLNAAKNIREKYLTSLASVGTPSLVGSQSSCLSSPPSGEGQASSFSLEVT
jgi:IS605 OrfB family transposase